MRTFTAQIVGFDPGHVTFRLPCGARKRLKAGEQTRRQAISLLGRNVRFQAALSEETESLASPLFVLGSSFGIQAVREQAELQGLRCEAAE